MADIEYFNSTDPEMQIKIDFSTERHGDQLTITATVYERFVGGNTPPYDFPGGSSLPYCGSGTGLYAGWRLEFNMWSGDVSNSVTIKNNSKWMWTSEKSRTRECSITITNASNTAPISCEIVTSNKNYTAGTMPTQSKTISVESFRAPTAPTWINVSPNPCDIYGKPLITWGGSHYGSITNLEYDLDMRALKPNGEWTEWERWKNNYDNTSYTSNPINTLVVSGQSAYAGIKYQYRVRCWDGYYNSTVSNWLNSSILTISFTAPTAPTNFSWSSLSYKKGSNFKISWSGATGGSGNITKYDVEFLYYTKNNNTWTNKGSVYLGNNSSYIGSLETLFPTAKNGDKIMVRVRTNNSWNMWSSFNNSPSASIRANQIWVKVNGNWVEGNCYIKVNGNWVEGLPYIKVNGNWKEST